MTPLWAYEVSESFWTRAGNLRETFPRDLRQAIALALPVAVVDLPGLRLGSMEAWLARRGAAIQLVARDRRVRACLVAYGGGGVVFLDGADPDDERRYSLAHEVAHFLLEHDLPRHRATERLSKRALEVLDGRRPALRIERIDALLAGISLSVDVHFLDRTANGLPEHAAVSAVERRAELLALELLAPFEALQSHVGPDATAERLTKVLIETFGLPARLAGVRARELAPDDVYPGLLDRLDMA